jgi:hypothetical protein
MKPHPIFVVLNHAYRGLRNAKQGGYSSLRKLPFKALYLGKFVPVKLSRPMGLASQMRSVSEPIRVISCTRVPSNMPGIAASSVPAPVSRLMFFSGRFTVSGLANETMSRPHTSVQKNPAISVAAFSERPVEALVALMVNMREKPCHRFAIPRVLDHWSAAPKPIRIVGSAPAACLMALAATRYGASGKVRHINLLLSICSLFVLLFIGRSQHNKRGSRCVS